MKRFIVLVALVSAACSLGGSPPRYQYFVLTSTHAQAVPGGDAQRSLVVDRVSIPGYLDREQIATRTVDHQLVYSTSDRWAEPLDQAFERMLREELAARLAPSGIRVQLRGGAPTYELGVDVLRFERSGSGQVELWARWILSSEANVVDSGETRLQIAVSGGDSNATASALSDAIARMAGEIAERVSQSERSIASSTAPR